jgi:hypothetical protein
MSNFLVIPTYICRGTYRPDEYKPIWFVKPEKLFDTDDMAVGPKQTAEVTAYTSFTKWKDGNMLWYPDRKFYLLGKNFKIKQRGKS